jgi:hypothetical protein
MTEGQEAKDWIEAYLKRKPAALAAVGEGLRKLVKKTVKGTKESVNPWKLATFESNGPMAYLSVGKNHITFGLLRGTALPDPKKLLEGTGKNLRHVKLRTEEDLQNPALTKLIEAAARLNKEEPMEGLRRKRDKKK